MSELKLLDIHEAARELRSGTNFVRKLIGKGDPPRSADRQKITLTTTQRKGHAESQRRYRKRKLLVISDVTKATCDKSYLAGD